MATDFAESFIGMESVFTDLEGVARSISEPTSSHYIVKIQSFSLLANNVIEKYESGEFESGGYKWKLVLYPNGNKSYNVNDHLSLYIAMADTSSLVNGLEVRVTFQLFLLNRKRDKYLIVQGKERWFHQFKTECGFDEFIPLEDFYNASNGYLVGDTCVLGANVFVKKSTGKGECFSMIKNASMVKHVWKIENFSKLVDEYCYSEKFNAGEQKWNIELHPNGYCHAAGNHLSLFLSLWDLENVTPGAKIYASFTLRIINQNKKEMHKTSKGDHWFTASSCSWGWHEFVPLNEFNQSSNGFQVNDVCVLEAEVTVLGITKEL